MIVTVTEGDPRAVLAYAELFAGAGGLSLGLEAGGFHPFAHAEIEPHACAVLRHHWPDVRLDGDVTQINGADYRGVTLLSGGSPCQDLSVAGKRAGLVDGARSSLFFEQVRIWQESNAPYLLWENVYGALSSNKGDDFALVLGALVGADVAVPLVNGQPKWLRSGRAVGPAGVAAWRVLDLQHFGPPQRRVRVFVLCARTGGVDIGEVLLESSGMCRHYPPRDAAREGVTGGAARGVGGSSGIADRNGVVDSMTVGANQTTGCASPTGIVSLQEVGKRTGVSTTDWRAGIGISEVDAAIYTLQAGAQHGVMAFQDSQSATRASDTIGTIDANYGPRRRLGVVDASIGKNGDAVPHVIAFDTTQITSPANYSNPKAGDPCHPLSAGAHPPAIAFQPGNLMRRAGSEPSGSVFPTLGADTQGDQAPHVLAFDTKQHGSGGDVAPTLRAMNHDTSHQNGGGQVGVIAFHHTQDPISGSVSPAIGGTTTGMGVVQVLASEQANAELVNEGDPSLTALHEAPIVFPTISAQDGRKWGCSQWVDNGHALIDYGRPRRLTPVECERLMGWPDQHTAIGTRDDGTTYALSDTARYRLCGNGVGSPQAAWIAKRLAFAIRTVTPS